MQTKISLMAMNDYMKGHLFDGLQVPEGADRETLIDAILLRSVDFGVCCQNAEMLQQIITHYGKRFLEPMRRTWRAITEDYNPLHNFDRHEDYTDTSTATGATGEQTTSSDTQSYMGDTADTFRPANKNDGSAQTAANSRADASAQHNGHLYGNIGVTKSQEMLRDEMSVRLDVEFYGVWADKFISELCIMVY